VEWKVTGKGESDGESALSLAVCVNDSVEIVNRRLAGLDYDISETVVTIETLLVTGSTTIGWEQ
jgi:hypothetical protein